MSNNNLLNFAFNLEWLHQLYSFIVLCSDCYFFFYCCQSVEFKCQLLRSVQQWMFSVLIRWGGTSWWISHWWWSMTEAADANRLKRNTASVCCHAAWSDASAVFSHSREYFTFSFVLVFYLVNTLSVLQPCRFFFFFFFGFQGFLQKAKMVGITMNSFYQISLF